MDEGLPVTLLSEATGWQFQPWPYGHGIQTIHDDVAQGNARFGANIGVAVIDGGVDCLFNGDIPACAGGYDFTGEGNPYSGIAHGTETASLIMAYVNALGIRGIAPQAAIYSLKIFDSNGYGTCLGSASAIDYATYTLSTTVSILNMSYGRPANNISDSTSYQSNCESERIAVSNAVSAKRFLSVAAGNTPNIGDSVGYPARLPGVSAVGGLTCPSFSGASCTGTMTFWPLSSRGEQLSYSASADNMYVLTPGNALAVVTSGTSFAAPVVSGIVAAIQSRYNLPRTGPCMINHLKNTASRRPGWTTRFYGAGAVRADVAWATTPICGGAPGPL